MKIPFQEMLLLALKTGIKPKDFWLLSLCEWRACFMKKSDAMNIENLKSLMNKFKDE